jgi:hypothetical protein
MEISHVADFQNSGLVLGTLCLPIDHVYANGNVPRPPSSSAFVDRKLDPLETRPVTPSLVLSSPSCLLTPTAGLGGALTSAKGASTTKTSSPAPSWYAL